MKNAKFGFIILRDTSPRHACLGEVSRKIWLHNFAINNNGGSVPVIFTSLMYVYEDSNFGNFRLPYVYAYAHIWLKHQACGATITKVAST